MKRCLDCQELIQDQARVCRYCGRQFSAGDLQQVPTERRRSAVLLFVLILVVVVFTGRWLEHGGVDHLANISAP